MKNFTRNDRLFSLCGLNCALCPMYLDKHCPGCGGGPGNQTCKIAKCSIERGGYEYCHLCEDYPCEKYIGIDEYDSFISHRNQLQDMIHLKTVGSEAYRAMLMEKAHLLQHLLSHYNDGRRKSFYCIAVNLLCLEDLKMIMAQLETQSDQTHLTLKEKATFAAECFKTVAEARNIQLKLNKKKAQS